MVLTGIKRQKARTSFFVKKEAKKLLSIELSAFLQALARLQKVFGSFFQKPALLWALLLKLTARYNLEMISL
jgi:hypothetical protein